MKTFKNFVRESHELEEKKKKLSPEKRAARAPDSAVVTTPAQRAKDYLKRKLRLKEAEQVDEGIGYTGPTHIIKTLKRAIKGKPSVAQVQAKHRDKAHDFYHSNDEKSAERHMVAHDKIRKLHFAAKGYGNANIRWEQVEQMEEAEQLDERGANKYKRSTESGAGLTRAGVMKYRRENPGSKLSTAVTTKPSKLKKGSKAWNRRKSFCARMSGVKGPMKDEKGRPTRKAMSLRRWNCE